VVYSHGCVFDPLWSSLKKKPECCLFYKIFLFPIGCAFPSALDRLRPGCVAGAVPVGLRRAPCDTLARALEEYHRAEPLRRVPPPPLPSVRAVLKL